MKKSGYYAEIQWDRSYEELNLTATTADTQYPPAKPFGGTLTLNGYTIKTLRYVELQHKHTLLLSHCCNFLIFIWLPYSHNNTSLHFNLSSNTYYF